MITLKADKVSEGIEVQCEIEGTPMGCTLEVVHLIAVLMREIKTLSEDAHAAVLECLANDARVLLGEYVGDDAKIRKGAN